MGVQEGSWPVGEYWTWYSFPAWLVQVRVAESAPAS